MTTRIYTTRRAAIIESMVEAIKSINGSGDFASNLSGNVHPKIVFIESITDFPTVCVIASSETRTYQAGGYKDRFMTVKIVLFVNEENPLTKLDAIMEDIETVLELNAQLSYKDRRGNLHKTIDITLNSISTDEGAFEPIALGEMNFTVRY